MALPASPRPYRGAIAAKVGLLLAVLALSSSGALARETRARASALAGTYDGGQMEMAAGLQLLPNGRFRYALAYGALDESAEGIWSAERDRVLLTSDPVKPPSFVFLEQRPALDGKTRVALDLPKGWSRQVFHVEIGLDDGRVLDRQLSDDDDAIAIDPGEKPQSVRLHMDVYDLRSDAFRLTGATAYSIRARFDPNDLGKVAFAKTPLRIDGRNLILDRFGRTIVFRRVSGRSARQ